MNKLILFIAVLAMKATGQQTVSAPLPGGTSGAIPQFSGATTIVDSPIRVSGNNIGIGTASPQATFGVATGGSDPNGALASSYPQAIAMMGQGGTVLLRATHDGGYAYDAATQLLASAWDGTSWIWKERMRISSAGYVGIGTTNPSVSLQVGATGTNSGAAIQNIAAYFVGPYNDTTNTTQVNVLGFGATAVDTSNIYSQNGSENYKNWFVGTRSQGQFYGSPSFVVLNRGVERLTVDTTGNVGIGTPAPTRKLHIAGDVQIDGNLYFGSSPQAQGEAYAGVKCGGDYAESVDVAGSRKEYEPGDVLVIGLDTTSDVSKATEPYSTLVAGIYSTKPGVVGRRQTTDQSKSQTEIPMAMVGIVPTKVSAENGAIHRGDLLVTSSTAGYAMKGTDRDRMLGAVIGKAMGRLESGTGIIEVLVSLQ